MERRISEIIRGKMRLIGPNCLGVMNPIQGLNATFAHTVARPGNMALSARAAHVHGRTGLSLRENVGFSAFVSIGSMLDVDSGDLIDYFGNDPRTKSIVIYMESIGDARSFLSAAREVSLSKPVIVIKAGRTAAAAKALPRTRVRSPVATKFWMPRSAAAEYSGLTASQTFSSCRMCWPSSRVPAATACASSPMRDGPGVLATDA